MPTPIQLLNSNPLTLSGSEALFAQSTTQGTGGATAAQVANCVDPLYYRRVFMPRAASGGKGTDMGANAFALTFANSPTTVPVVGGQDAYAFSFNGTNQAVYATSANASCELLGDFTLEAWCRPQSGVAGFVLGTCLASAGVGIDIGTSGFYVYFGGQSSGSNIISLTPTISSTVYSHVAAVRLGTTVTAYLNGVAIGTATNSTALTDAAACVGSDNNGGNGFFTGQIYAPRISQFAQYATNFSPPTTPFPVIP